MHISLGFLALILAVASQAAAAQLATMPAPGKPHPGVLMAPADSGAAQSGDQTAQQTPPQKTAQSSAAAGQAGAKPAGASRTAVHKQAAAQPVVHAASFTVSQLGHVVGKADFRFVNSATGCDSTSTVEVQMQGLDYALSKSEQLDKASHIRHVMVSATVNGSAVSVTGKPEAGQFLLNISANGRSTTTRLQEHESAVFLPDFDPGGLQSLLTVASAQNNRDLWAIIPKQAGSVEAVQLATYADEHGTLDGKPIAVHHLVATIAGAATDLFSSPENRLLQAELSQQGFSLVRKGFVLAPPRKPVARVE